MQTQLMHHPLPTAACVDYELRSESAGSGLDSRNPSPALKHANGTHSTHNSRATGNCFANQDPVQSGPVNEVALPLTAIIGAKGL
jgi:hypothetical protein